MIFCPECGYDLHGIASERCPECGAAIDAEALARSRIPWSHRGQLGWWRAYVQTVDLVLFRPKILATEIARPVDFRDAQMFRWVTVAAVGLNLVGFLLIWLARTDNYGAGMEYARVRDQLSIPVDLGAGIVALMAGGSIAGLIVLTGAASYFFHPRSLPVVAQNRAIALGYYPCAMLLPAALCIDLAIVGVRLNHWLAYITQPRNISTFLAIQSLMVILLLVAVVFVVAFGWKTIVLLGRTTHCGIGRRILAALVMFFALALLPGLAVGFSVAVGWLILLLRG